MALFELEYTSHKLTISDIHAFHSKERKLYSRMVFDLHMNHVRSMEIIAFWLWLEERERDGIIDQMNSFDDFKLRTSARIAYDFVVALRLLIPDRGINYDFHQEAIRGIKHYLNSVCFRALGDIQNKVVEMEMLVYQMSQACLEPSDCDVEREVELGQPFNLGMPQLPENLNTVTGRHQQPSKDNLPEDERTLFVTFSNGYPLTKLELLSFFMRCYGDVESVDVQASVENKPPQYAHVTFYKLSTLFQVLGGALKVKFIINKKHLWARRYIPKRNPHSTEVDARGE